MTIYEYRELELITEEKHGRIPNIHLGLWDSEQDISIYDFRCLGQEADYLLGEKLKGKYNNREWDVIRIGRTLDHFYTTNEPQHTGLMQACEAPQVSRPRTLREIVDICERVNEQYLYRGWDRNEGYRPSSVVVVRKFAPLICSGETHATQEIFDVLLEFAEEVEKEGTSRSVIASSSEMRRVSDYIKRFLAIHTFNDNHDEWLDYK